MKLLSSPSLLVSALLVGCATPPQSDPSKYELACAQQCQGTLATCSSGFKFFPVIVQKQCNDNYDVCLQGCPPRDTSTSLEKLDRLKALRDTGVITQKEYEAKRKVIVDSLVP